MRLTRRTKIQLVVFAVIALVAVASWFSATCGYRPCSSASAVHGEGAVDPGGRSVPRGQRHLPWRRGRADADVRLTNTGAEAVLQLKSGIHIPADLSAEVHSVSAVGEQYVALLPRSGKGRR